MDFTLQSKHDGSVHISEMKCELEYENYRFLTLEAPWQLDHHTKAAFQVFLDAARHPTHYVASVSGKPQPSGGSILVWGRYTQQGRASVIEKYVRLYPDQWLWIHKRWNTRPPGEVDLYASNEQKANNNGSGVLSKANPDSNSV